jgi:hypothetical protein
VIRAVQAAAHLATGRAMDRPTAAAVATLILTGRTVDNPVSYVRRVIRDDPSMLRVEEPEQPPASKRQTCRHHDPCPKVKHCGNCASTEHSLAFCPLIDAEQDRRQAEADALKGYPGAYTRKWTQEVFPDRTDKPDGAQAARVLREELTKRAQSMRGDAEARRRAYTAARAAERAAANGQPDEATRDGAGLDGGGDRKLSDADGPF